MNKILLVIAIVILAWASVLAFGFVDDAELVEDALGWGFLGLAVGFASTLDLRWFNR